MVTLIGTLNFDVFQCWLGRTNYLWNDPVCSCGMMRDRSNVWIMHPELTTAAHDLWFLFILSFFNRHTVPVWRIIQGEDLSCLLLYLTGSLCVWNISLYMSHKSFGEQSVWVCIVEHFLNCLSLCPPQILLSRTLKLAVLPMHHPLIILIQFFMCTDYPWINLWVIPVEWEDLTLLFCSHCFI